MKCFFNYLAFVVQITFSLSSNFICDVISTFVDNALNYTQIKVCLEHKYHSKNIIGCIRIYIWEKGNVRMSLFIDYANQESFQDFFTFS